MPVSSWARSRSARPAHNIQVKMSAASAPPTRQARRKRRSTSRKANRPGCEDGPVQVETRDAYLELLKQCLTRALFVGEERSKGRRRRGTGAMMRLLAARGY